MVDQTVQVDGEPCRAPGPPPAEELAARLDALTQAVHMRDRAMAVLAHDLRSPMEIISATAAQLLLTLREPGARGHLERIERMTRRAASLIDDLLDVSALETGGLSLARTPTDLAQTIAATVEAHRVVAERRGVVISADLHAGVPLAEVDQHRIEEVLQNLLDNSLKFTPAGGAISVGLSVRAGDIVAWVRDTGPGIPKADLPHLFEPFRRGESARWRARGLGLGICKTIVEGHGGKIWVDSAVGRGTVVHFALPVRGERDGQ